jgi:hypothetical protein
VSRDFSLSPRAQSADEAERYFDTFWKLSGVDVDALDGEGRSAYDEARHVFVDLCAKRLANPAQETALNARHEVGVKWATDQGGLGREVWGHEMPISVMIAHGLVEPHAAPPAARAREGSRRRRRGSSASRGDSGDRPPLRAELAEPKFHRRWAR